MPELEVLEAKVPVRTPRLIEVETEPDDRAFRPGRRLAQRSRVQPRSRHLRGEHDRASRPGGRPGADDPDDHPRDGRDAGRGPRDRGPLDRRHQGDAARAEPARRASVRLDRQGRAGARPRTARTSPRRRWSNGRRPPKWPTACATSSTRSSRCCAATRPTSPSFRRKLREARARQNAIAARFESAVTRARAREIMHGSRTARRVRQVRAARAPRRLRRRPLRCAGHQQPRRRDRPAQGRREDRRRAGSHESRAAKARGELKEGRGNDDGPQDLSVFARPQGREGRRRLLDARRRSPGSTRPSSASRFVAAAIFISFKLTLHRLRRDRHLPRGAEEAGR